jgi:hypothetical protein
MSTSKAQSFSASENILVKELSNKSVLNLTREIRELLTEIEYAVGKETKIQISIKMFNLLNSPEGYALLYTPAGDKGRNKMYEIVITKLKEFVTDEPKYFGKFLNMFIDAPVSNRTRSKGGYWPPDQGSLPPSITAEPGA